MNKETLSFKELNNIQGEITPKIVGEITSNVDVAANLHGAANTTVQVLITPGKGSELVNLSINPVVIEKISETASDVTTLL